MTRVQVNVEDTPTVANEWIDMSNAFAIPKRRIVGGSFLQLVRKEFRLEIEKITTVVSWSKIWRRRLSSFKFRVLRLYNLPLPRHGQIDCCQSSPGKKMANMRVW